MPNLFSNSFFVNAIQVKPKHNQILKKGEIVSLEPLAMQLLVYLAKRSDQVVTSKEIFEALWQGRVVSENALHRIIGQLRKALDDNPSNPEFIRTIKKQGYSFIAKVDGLDQAPEPTFSKIKIATLLLLSVTIITIWIFSNAPEKIIEITDVRQLSSLPGIESDPVLLPDGESMLFTHRPAGELYNNVVLKSLHSTDYEYVTDDYLHYDNLALAPDGIHLAFILRDDQNCQVQFTEISLVDKDATEPVTLSNCRFYASNKLAWSHDSATLFFTHNDAEKFSSQIYYSEIKGGKSQPLLSERPENSDDYLLTQSTDGKLFAYARYWSNKVQIRAFNTKTNQEFLLKEFDQLPSLRTAAWTIDKDLLINTSEHLYKLSLNGDLKEMNNVEIKKADRMVADDNNNIVYSTLEYAIKLSEFTLLSDDSEVYSQPVSDSSNNEYAGVYSSDGQRIAFLSDRENNKFRLWLKHKDKIQLMSDVNVTARPIRWSPNDQAILYYDENRRLSVFNLQENSITQITEEEKVIGSAIWKPDGRGVIYSQLNDDGFQLYEKNFDAPLASQLTENGGYHSQVDDHYIFYNKYDKPGLWRINLKTNKHEIILENFHGLNYSRWQLFNDGFYYHRDKDAIRGLYFYDFASETESTLIARKEIYHFDIAADRSKVLISEQEELSGDIFIAKLSE